MKNSRFSRSYGTFFAICVLALTGCATTTPAVSIPSVGGTVNFDGALLQDCGSLPHLKSGADTDVNTWSAAVTESYSSCAALKHSENVEIKKALNIK